MNKNQKFTTSLGIMTCACALLAASSSQAAEYQVTVNTTSLIGNVNAPYYVDFQLNSGGGPFSNMATVNNFNFGGGSPSPVGSAMVYVGNPTGDLSTGFTLVDVPGATSTSAFNEISQQFTPGSTLSFDVTLTDNGGAQVPDEFEFAIDDSSTYQIPTTSLDGISLAVIDINRAFSNPAISTAVYSPTDPQYAGMTVSITPVPEPSSLGVFGLGLGAIALYGAGKRVKKAV
jgi:PEP-CTERM motif